MTRLHKAELGRTIIDTQTLNDDLINRAMRNDRFSTGDFLQIFVTAIFRTNKHLQNG